MTQRVLISDVHFLMRPTVTRVHFSCNRRGDTSKVTGPRYTAQVSTRRGQVIQRIYSSRREWISDYHRLQSRYSH